MTRFRRRIAALAAVVVFLGLTVPGFLSAQSLQEFEKNLTEFTLNNGLKFLVLERHNAPVISFRTYVDVGSVNEVTGITGMAHIFEHMAFKGTRTIGTKNYPAEARAMAKVDSLFMAIKREKWKGRYADRKKIKELQKEFEVAQQEAGKYIVHDEFEEVLTREGASGLNASTSRDATQYVVSLPSNKLELWMLMESDRFYEPVLREFYKEKNVVMEERRLRTESQPVGRLLEEFLAIAYKAHPYGQPVIGHMSDLKAISRPEARQFFHKYYIPSNMTIAIVGDVNPEEVRKLAQKYFGRIPSKPKPAPVETVEPPQNCERKVTILDPSQPFLLMGYHKPDINDDDNAVFDAITDIMGIGRTSRLYRSLVRDKKIAVAASAIQGIPGNKYPGLFLFYAVPAKGHSNAECEKAIEEEIERLKKEPVTEEELQKAKTRSRARLIHQLESNSGLAGELAFYETVTGDWRNLFRQLDKIDKVTAADIQRVAKKYFVPGNRNVGVIETKAEGK